MPYVIDFVKNELLLGKTPMCLTLETDNLAALTRAIDAAMALPPDRLPGAVQHALQASFADGNWLTPAQRQPDPQRYARHVLQADPQGRYTVVALVWQAGQFSPVHAHHTWCALTVVQGELQEHYYTCDRQSLRATPLHWQPRAVGAGSSGTDGLDQVHRLGNAGAGVAISVHVYGVEAARVATGVNRVLALAS